MSTKKKFYEEVYTETTIDENGKQNSKEVKTEKSFISGEPDYIKVYTKMYGTFFGLSETALKLFMSLAHRMNYASKDDPESQIVDTRQPYKSSIMEECGWNPKTSEKMFKSGIKVLLERGLVRRVSRGIYQINPNYVGKGGWRWNEKEAQGGISDLVATFRFAEQKVETTIIYKDDYSNDDSTDDSLAYRDEEGIRDPKVHLTVTTMQKEAEKQEDFDNDGETQTSTDQQEPISKIS